MFISKFLQLYLRCLHQLAQVSRLARTTLLIMITLIPHQAWAQDIIRTNIIYDDSHHHDNYDGDADANNDATERMKEYYLNVHKNKLNIPPLIDSPIIPGQISLPIIVPGVPVEPLNHDGVQTIDPDEKMIFPPGNHYSISDPNHYPYNDIHDRYNENIITSHFIRSDEGKGPKYFAYAGLYQDHTIIKETINQLLNHGAHISAQGIDAHGEAPIVIRSRINNNEIVLQLNHEEADEFADLLMLTLVAGIAEYHDIVDDQLFPRHYDFFAKVLVNNDVIAENEPFVLMIGDIAEERLRPALAY